MEVHQLEPRSRGEGEVASPQYRAVLQREGDGHFVHCQIEVLAGNQSWTGSRVGSGLQQALAECLAHMTLRSQVAQAS
jgi:5-carboxymethyl-2-hydroxymuconate isomerase